MEKRTPFNVHENSCATTLHKFIYLSAEWMGTSQLPLLLRDSYCSITLYPRVLLTEYIALRSHFRHIRLKHLL